MGLKEMVGLLCCPVCDDRPALEIRGDSLVCVKCSREYPAPGDIPNLLPQSFSKETVQLVQGPEEAPLLSATDDPELRVLVIHGPNLNLLGVREPDVYGHATLQDVDQSIHDEAIRLGCRVSIMQSNSEGDIVSAVQSVIEQYAGLIINPAAYTHTSIAIRDALAAIDAPKVEVHLSNIHAREDFRKTSITGAVVDGIISGFGPDSYVLALNALIKVLRSRR